MLTAFLGIAEREGVGSGGDDLSDSAAKVAVLNLLFMAATGGKSGLQPCVVLAGGLWGGRELLLSGWTNG